MRVEERMQLRDNIGLELQKRYVWNDVTEFVSQCGVSMSDPAEYEGPNSKRYFAKYLLCNATEEELLAEIREGYDGKVVSGRDLDVF